jgi:hypothetical protein
VGIAWIGFWIISSTVSSALEGVRDHAFRVAAWQEASAGGNRYSPDAWQRVQERVEKEQAEAAKTDWRPLCSYTDNLRRIGEALLNTDAAWVEIGRAVEAPRVAIPRLLGRRGATTINNRRLADQLVPQYPWIWSAGVLAGLLGLSIWTLSTRVKSLDRLK